MNGNDQVEVEAEVELLVQTGMVAAKDCTKVAAVLRARRILKQIESRSGVDELRELLERLRVAIDSLGREGERFVALSDMLKPLSEDGRCEAAIERLRVGVRDFRAAVGAIRVPDEGIIIEMTRARHFTIEALNELKEILRV